MNDFLVTIRSMVRHFQSNEEQFPAGKYWRPLCQLTVKQAEIYGCDLFSPEWYYASTFGGGALNGIKAISESERRGFRNRLASKVLAGLVRYFPESQFVNPLWRFGFSGRRLAFASDDAAFNYTLLVKYGYALFREEIEKYNLQSPDIYGADAIAVDEPNGRKLSYNTLRMFNVFLKMRELIRPATDSVVEIGAGSGELARIFLATGAVRRYVIVDIPPALAFSQRLLGVVFGEDRIGKFDPERTHINFSDDKVCYFLTPDQIRLVPAFDVGINMASFAEMNKDIVSSYIRILKKAGFKEFISINQRMKKIGNPDLVGEAEYLECFSPEHRLQGKYSFTTTGPVLLWLPDTPGKPGVQLLHFSNA